jgi:hypothetical protein
MLTPFLWHPKTLQYHHLLLSKTETNLPRSIHIHRGVCMLLRYELVHDIDPASLAANGLRFRLVTFWQAQVWGLWLIRTGWWSLLSQKLSKIFKTGETYGHDQSLESSLGARLTITLSVQSCFRGKYAFSDFFLSKKAQSLKSVGWETKFMQKPC